MKAFKKTAADSVRLLDGIPSPILIRTKPSFILLVAVLAAHACSISAIVLSAMPFGLRLVCVVLVFCSAVIYYYQWRNIPCFRLQKNQNHQWVFYSDINKSHTLAIEACYYWSQYLVILRVTDQHSRRFFYPILMDSCDAESYRQLRVLAKFLL